VPANAKLLLVVEGETDQAYLKLASQHLGISLDEVHILPRGGAAGAVLEALALGARYAPGRAVAALFDSDETGKNSYKQLGETFRWKQRSAERLHALILTQWLDDTNVTVEAEDLFANATLNVFLSEPENERYCTERVKRGKKWGTWHIGLDGEGKKAFALWLAQHGTAAMFEPWRPVLEHLRRLSSPLIY
jgi:putative ATP-dependent endonuclease of the OLD family